MFKVFKYAYQAVGYGVNQLIGLFTNYDQLSSQDFNKLSASELNKSAAYIVIGKSLSTANQDQLFSWIVKNPNEFKNLNQDALGYINSETIKRLNPTTTESISGDAWINWIKAPPKLYSSGLTNGGWGVSHTCQYLPNEAFKKFDENHLNSLVNLNQKININQFKIWKELHQNIEIFKLDPKIFSLFSGDFLNGEDLTAINQLSARQIEKINLSEVRTFKSSVLNNISDSALVGFKPSQICAIDPKYFAEWRPEKINQLNAQQLSAVEPAQVSLISEENFSFLTPQTINSLPSALIGVTINQFYKIPKATLAELTFQTLSKFSFPVISHMDASEWKAWLSNADNKISQLNPEVYKYLPAEIIEGIPPDDLILISSKSISFFEENFQFFNKQSLENFTKSQWEKVTPVEMASLSVSKIAGLPSIAWKSLSMPAISALTAEQASVIPLEKIPDINPSSIRGFSANALNAMSELQIKALSSNQLSKLHFVSSFVDQLEKETIDYFEECGVHIGGNEDDVPHNQKVNILDAALIVNNTYWNGQLNVPDLALTVPSAKWKSLGQPSNSSNGFKGQAWMADDQIIIAFNGSDLTTFNESGQKVVNPDIADWLGADLDMGLYTLKLKGTTVLAKQVISALEFVDIIVKNNPNKSYTFAGHSLGGSLSSILGVLLGNEAIAFDEGPVGATLRSDDFRNQIRNWRNSSENVLNDSFREKIDVYLGSKNLTELINQRDDKISAYRVNGEMLDLVSVGVSLVTGKDPRIAGNVVEFNTPFNADIDHLDLNIFLSKGQLMDSALKHNPLLLIASIASQDFREALKSLGLMASAIVPLDATKPNDLLPFDYLIHEFSINNNNSDPGKSSPLHAFASDLNTLVNHQGQSSSAWSRGTNLSMSLIGIAAFDHSQSKNDNDLIFSSLPGGVLLQSNSVGDSQWHANLRNEFVKQIPINILTSEYSELFYDSLSDIKTFAIQDESGSDFIFKSVGEKTDVAVLGSLSGDNYIEGGNHAIIAVGGSKNNYIYGGSMDDFIIGAGCFNKMDGGGGDNVIVTGAGVDVISFSSSNKKDVVYNFSVETGDKLDLQPLGKLLNLNFEYKNSRVEKVGDIYFDGINQQLNVWTGLNEFLQIKLSGLSNIPNYAILI